MVMKIKFRIYGKAISENTAYRRRKQGYGMFMTPEGKAWKEAVAWSARASLTKALSPSEMKKDVHLHMTFYFGDKRRRDCHNYEKLLIDGLEGILFENDSQVTSHYAEIKQGEPSVTVELTTKDHDEPINR